MAFPQQSSNLRPGELFAAVVDSLLDDGLSVRFRAGGRSMAPTVRDGEYLLVAPIDPARVEIGDVVFCRMRRGPVAHRVVAIESTPDASPASGSPRFILCGDASQDCDRPATADQLLGKVVSVERGGEQLSLAIVGGWFGRFAMLTALRLRRTILAARARLPVTPFASAHVSR